MGEGVGLEVGASNVHIYMNPCVVYFYIVDDITNNFIANKPYFVYLFI